MMKTVSRIGRGMTAVALILSLLVSFGTSTPVSATNVMDATYQTLPFSQDWTDINLITTSDDWTGVPGITGYRGDGLTGSTGVDPQTVLADGSGTPPDVNANLTDPDTFFTGGVAEFEITNPVVALNGSGTADAPFIVVYLDTTGYKDITVAYNVRDLDGTTDNAIQQVALHYRVGTSGDYTNVPAAYIADATTGPSTATLVTAVNVILPLAVENQAQVELRIMTTNALGNDEWVGIDDISITGTLMVPEIALNKTVGTDPISCATTDEITLPAGGGEVTYCYTVENTGNVTLNLHDLYDNELGNLFTSLSYVLAPGASAFITETATINVTTVNTAIWTAYNVGPTDVVTATDVATVTVEVANPSIALNKTVGTDPLTCAVTDEVALPAGGGEVTYCYEIENTGNVTLNLHDLYDNQLGNIFTSLSYALAPGASAFITDTATINVTTVNTAIWTAYNVGPTNAVTATDVATVTVAPPGPPNIMVNPLSLSSTQAPDVTTNQTLDIANTGGEDLTWEILEEPGMVVRSTAGGLAPRASVIGATGSRGGAPDVTVPRAYLSMVDFSEGFDDITLLPGLGWFFQNNSAPVGTTTWFQGTTTVFPAHVGDPAAYIGANYNSTSGVGTISNWMLTPEISLMDGDTISFWTRVPAGSTWPDRLEMRLSTNGASTNVGTLATDVGDFTTLLLSVNPTLAAGGYPEAWTQYSATLAGIPVGATGRVAFRYFVENGGPSGSNSNYIGIDTFEVVTAQQGICDAPSDVPWLSTAPITGTTVGGATTPVDVAFDSTGLMAGTYTANLCVESNDPDAGPGNETSLVVVPVTLTVTQVLTPSIVLTKTVGTVAGVCATTDDITVMEGTEVYYCYQIQNTGSVTLTLHDLVDTELGTILTALPYDLAPGALSPQVIVPATLSATTVNTATWTAYNVVGGPVATATDTARVVVEPSAVSVTGLRASAAGGWSSVALLGALALGGVAWRRKRR